VLRRFGDVLLTLIPLLMAGVVTMELMACPGMKLLPTSCIATAARGRRGVQDLLHHGGGGQTELLQSSLTRAVMFSALTTATAFGSLWLSSHRDLEHGQAMALAGDHDGGSSAVPACSDGSAAGDRCLGDGMA
jgi:hypothetical protein